MPAFPAAYTGLVGLWGKKQFLFAFLVNLYRFYLVTRALTEDMLTTLPPPPPLSAMCLRASLQPLMVPSRFTTIYQKTVQFPAN